jgi:hypothetical protein
MSWWRMKPRGKTSRRKAMSLWRIERGVDASTAYDNLYLTFLLSLSFIANFFRHVQSRHYLIVTLCVLSSHFLSYMSFVSVAHNSSSSPRSPIPHFHAITPTYRQTHIHTTPLCFEHITHAYCLLNATRYGGSSADSIMFSSIRLYLTTKNASCTRYLI